MTTIYVNSDLGEDLPTNSKANPFKTITYALKQANIDTIIELAPGTYNAASGETFPLLIPAGVKVIGNETNKGKDILISGSGVYISPTFSQQNITLSLENNASLLGVTLINNTADSTGVWLESGEANITNCTFTNTQGNCILATGTAKPVISSNFFINNQGNGIVFTKNSKGELVRNKFQNTVTAITMKNYAAPLIIFNHILENQNGIFLTDEVRPVIRYNRIEKNQENGLKVLDKALPELGNRQDAGGNIIQQNLQYDLENLSSLKLVSVGNQLNPTKTKGNVEFEANIPSISFPEMRLTPHKFADVSEHWAEAFIENLGAMNIVRGFPDGTFKPDNKLTRAEYASLLVGTFPMTVKRAATQFKDVPDNFWAKEAIKKANQAVFLSGYPDLTFRPNQNLTREQAIVALVGGLGLTGGNLISLSLYRDRAQISSYATEKVATATQKRLIVNYPTVDLIEPRRDITRAEVSAIIYQTLVLQSRTQPINSPYIV